MLKFDIWLAVLLLLCIVPSVSSCWNNIALEWVVKSSNAYCSAASMGRTNVWLNCESNSCSDVVLVSCSMDCSIRSAVLSKSVDRALNSASVCSRRRSVSVVGSCCVSMLSLVLGIRMLWCLLWILRRVPQRFESVFCQNNFYQEKLFFTKRLSKHAIQII